jgi:hypothetical protein
MAWYDLSLTSYNVLSSLGPSWLGTAGYDFRYLSNQAMVLAQASFAASCR